jgi:hypothetical protein
MCHVTVDSETANFLACVIVSRCYGNLKMDYFRTFWFYYWYGNKVAENSLGQYSMSSVSRRAKGHVVETQPRFIVLGW